MKDYTVTYENLSLSTYELNHIIQLQLTKGSNQHAVLQLTGILDEDKADQYIYTTQERTPVALGYLTAEGGQEILFQGMVTSLNITRQGDLYLLSLEAMSASRSMDSTRRCRSFQNVDMTVHQVIREVCAEYEDADFLMSIPDVPIGRLIVQYMETDWEFLVRLVSAYGAVLIPDVQCDHIAIYAGLPERGESYPAEDFHYTVSKSLDNYLYMKNNGYPDVNEIEFVTFEIVNQKVFQIGDILELSGKSLCIEQAVHILADGILRNIYYLRLKSGIRTLKIYNPNLVGASVIGTVAGISKDRILVDLSIDEKGRAMYWFPYSTMSASPNGSGWYCMPEKGDQVRVNFPTREEGDAYAVSAVSTSMGEDPNVKYLKTVHNHMIQFDDSGIVIKAGNGQALIQMGSNGQLNILGNQMVSVAAKTSLNLESDGQLGVAAGTALTLSSGQSGITIDEEGTVKINGTHVYNN